MAIGSRNKVSTEFNMSSMTDIVFLLLIFFMVTSTQISPNGLQVTLPKSANQVTPNQRTSVSITPDLQFAIEKQIIPFEQLEDALKTKLQGEAEPTILLRVDKDVPTGETVKVMDIANRNKWKFVLATKP
ncbi:MAG: biopolymer transport protein ExbD [Bacteroidetes bacterium ADurb.Bin217]|nr:MAG: biopolymer transport protein ExbD [Bacteroidetes bacterium ADurb.Bin217]HOS84258.1 biopolymer transporter ExbD [Bacteroidales bacterium]